MNELPEYYFRVRENGAAVFRISTDPRDRRIVMDEIAALNVKNGNIKPHGSYDLTKADMAVIKDWMADRRAVLAERDLDDIHRAVDHLNLTTQWAQSRASDADLEDVTDRLLLAMHDLRGVLVRKKADRILAEQKAAAND